MHSKMLGFIIVDLDKVVRLIRYCTLVRYTVVDNLCEISRHS